MTVPAARRYLPGTNVLETSWGTPNGWIIIRDVLLIGPWHLQDKRSHSHRRAPTDYDADHVLLRTVRCVNGEMQLTLDCEPVFDYGLGLGQWEYTEPGYHQGICRPERSEHAEGGPTDDEPEAEREHDNLELTLTTDMNIGFEGPRAIARTLIKEGETAWCALSWVAVRLLSPYGAPRVVAAPVVKKEAT